MNYADIWDAVRHRWLVVVLFVLLGGAVAYGYHQVVPARYTSTAEVMVTPPDGQSVDELASTINVTVLQANNLKASAKTDAVLVPVVERLGLNEDVADLASRVEATIAPNTSVISVTVRGVDATETAAIANAIVEQLQTDLSSLAPTDRAGFATVQIRLINEAKTPIAARSAYPAGDGVRCRCGRGGIPCRRHQPGH